MADGQAIDITFDFRTDTPPGGDPDELGPTLRRYHKVRWSKPLPSGAMFELESFDRSPLPDSVEAYTAYRQRAIAFIAARNRRIADVMG